MAWFKYAGRFRRTRTYTDQLGKGYSALDKTIPNLTFYRQKQLKRAVAGVFKCFLAIY